MIVDAAEGERDGEVLLDLVVIAGPHKGEVIQITAAGLEREPLDLLAVPATLHVSAGRPDVTIGS